MHQHTGKVLPQKWRIASKVLCSIKIHTGGVHKAMSPKTPKLPSRPKFLDVRKGYEYVEPESKKMQPVFESIVEKVKDLEHDRNELANVRATLIANFGPDGIAGSQCGVIIENAKERGNLPLLVLVLEKLFEKAMKK